MRRKKMLILILIIFFSLITLGCINGNNDSKKDEIRYYKPGDMKLKIDSDKESYNLNTSEILITAHFINVAKEPIKIQEGFDKGWNIEYNLTSPSNEKFYLSKGGPDIDYKKIVINPDDYFKYKFNLFNLSFYYSGEDFSYKEKYNWNETGIYKFSMGVKYPVYSNEIEFEIL